MSAVGTVVTGLYADTCGRRRTLALLGVLTAVGYLALAFLGTLPPLLIVAAATMVNGMGRDRGAASALEQLAAELCAWAEETRGSSGLVEAVLAAADVGGKPMTNAFKPAAGKNDTEDHADERTEHVKESKAKT